MRPRPHTSTPNRADAAAQIFSCLHPYRAYNTPGDTRNVRIYICHHIPLASLLRVFPSSPLLRHLPGATVGVLEHNPLVNASNSDMMVETVREISELVTWGDKHDTLITECFLEKCLPPPSSQTKPARLCDMNGMSAQGPFPISQPSKCIVVMLHQCPLLTDPCCHRYQEGAGSDVVLLGACAPNH